MLERIRSISDSILENRFAHSKRRPQKQDKAIDYRALEERKLLDGTGVFMAWSDPSTWPDGQVPQSGEDVVIRADQRVLFDVAEAEVGQLMIHGDLVFEDDENISLTADRIMVMGPDASLVAGTEDNLFQHDLTITLDQENDGSNPVMGYRVLGVMNGGSLQFHGADSNDVSWTQLAEDIL